jgi:uncharacterized protein (UPF0332 family)
MRAEYRELQRLRMVQAEESIVEAKLLFENHAYRGAVNRAYYAMFYAVLALIVPTDNNTSKHRGIISFFDREFVKTGKVDAKFSRWLHDAFNLRQKVDYKETTKPNESQAAQSLASAGAFVEEIRS